MNKEGLKSNFNVDADKVIFNLSVNGGYEYSRTSRETPDRMFIIREGDDYDVALADEGSLAQWRADLSELEEIEIVSQ